MLKKITCKTGLRKNIINSKIFNREVLLCQKLSRENKGKCGWGVCKKCGVVPLLFKLHKGMILEDKNEIIKVKKKHLK